MLVTSTVKITERPSGSYASSSYATSEISPSSYLPLSYGHLLEEEHIILPKRRGVLQVPSKISKWLSWRKRTQLTTCWATFNGKDLEWYKSNGNGTYKSTPMGKLSLASSLSYQFQDLSYDTFAIIDVKTNVRYLFTADTGDLKQQWIDTLCHALTIQDWYNGYRIGELLGQGGSSQVYALHDTTTGQIYAMKAIQTKGCPENAELVENEINVMRHLPTKFAHNLTKLYKTVEDHDGQVGLIMSYHRGGNLVDRILSNGIITQSNAQTRENDGKVLARTLLMVLSSLHDASILHLDIKPANILFHVPGDDLGKLIVADFGFGHMLTPERDSNLNSSSRGTIGYMAPELVEFQFGQAQDSANPPLSSAADIFSIGVVLYHYLFGFQPFQGPESDKIIERMLRGQMVRPLAQWSLVSSDAQDFLFEMLARNPTDRATISQLLLHRWLQDHAVA